MGSAGDSVRFDGVKSLRLLGTSEGVSVYVDASTRPRGAIEGTLATETLDSGPAHATVFFRDTALGASFGDDTIVLRHDDLFVTTNKLADRNADGPSLLRPTPGSMLALTG